MSNSSTEQPEFSFDRKVDHTKPDPSALIDFLSDRDWTLARDIPLANDRALRNLANASEGQIISGNRGYKLTRLATLEEISECTDRIRSQADRMIARSLEISRVYHRGK